MSNGMKKAILLLVLLIVILISIMIFYYLANERIVFGKDELYDKVEEYLVSLEEPHYFTDTKNAESDTNISDFKVFTDIERLGIRKKGDETYVYVWALIESYYVQDGNLIHNGGSSMPYRFIIKDNAVVTYQIPKDGSYYQTSINEIFPIDIRMKMGNGVNLVDSEALNEEVKEHYSYITNNKNTDAVINV